MIPAAADRRVFAIAPAVALVPYLVVMIVIPVGPGLVGADLDAGLFFVLAVLGVGVLGSIMAGWASANKYSAFGGVRTAAQLLSYEFPLVLTASSVAMAAGTLSLPGIVDQWQWWWPPWQAIGAVVFFVAGLAELRRPPFDMPIADSEIIMGPMTEYTGIRFALFMLAEYAGIVVLSALTAVLFLGGWQGPLLPGPVWTLIKIFAVAFLAIWIRVSFSRLREDQLQRLAWTGLVPLALVQLALTAPSEFCWPDAVRRPTPVGSRNRPGNRWWRPVDILWTVVWTLWKADRSTITHSRSPGVRHDVPVARVPGEGLAKGLAVTLRHMLHRSRTQQYPEVRPALPPRSRGVIALVEENCTVCMLCARECPDWCISIDSHKETLPAPEGGRPRVRNVLDRFAIDFSLCMYCGICVEVCPFDALFWSPEFEYAEYDIRDLVHEKDRLGEWVRTVPPPPPHEVGAEPPQEVAAASRPTRMARTPSGPAAAPEAATSPAASAAERPERSEHRGPRERRERRERREPPRSMRDIRAIRPPGALPKRPPTPPPDQQPDQRPEPDQRPAPKQQTEPGEES